MKIKYLKVMHNADVGDALEVTDFEANILIKAGVAEAVDSEVAATNANPQPTIAYTPIDTKGLLLNLNGTPVINDFGEVVVETPIQPKTAAQNVEEKPKPTRKPRNTAKAEQ